jgi:hypothetical protein
MLNLLSLYVSLLIQSSMTSLLVPLRKKRKNTVRDNSWGGTIIVIPQTVQSTKRQRQLSLPPLLPPLLSRSLYLCLPLPL